MTMPKFQTSMQLISFFCYAWSKINFVSTCTNEIPTDHIHTITHAPITSTQLPMHRSHPHNYPCTDHIHTTTHRSHPHNYPPITPTQLPTDYIHTTTHRSHPHNYYYEGDRENFTTTSLICTWKLGTSFEFESIKIIHSSHLFSKTLCQNYCEYVCEGVKLHKKYLLKSCPDPACKICMIWFIIMHPEQTESL